MIGLTLTRHLLRRRATAARRPGSPDTPRDEPGDDHGPPATRPHPPASPPGLSSLIAEHAIVASRIEQLRVRLTARYAGQAMPHDLHGRTPMTRLAEIEAALSAEGARLDRWLRHGLPEARQIDSLARFLADARLTLDRMEGGMERRRQRGRRTGQNRPGRP